MVLVERQTSKWTEGEGYAAQLEIARSDSKIIQMPTDINEDHFKERCYVAQLSIKVVAEQRKAEADLFNMLAGKMGPSNVLLSVSSEWAKENSQLTFIKLLAYCRHHLLAPNPSNIKAIKSAVSTYDNT
jgi:hypothetical protein